MKTTRDLLIEKTFFLMLEKGYDKFSVSDIQKSLGMSRGILYKYFKTKSELVFEACKRYYHEKFFPTMDDLDKISIKEFLDKSNKNLRALFRNLSCERGSCTSILKYNILFAEVMKNELQFKKFMYREYAKFGIVMRNAKKNGEIKKDVSNNFIRNVFTDIYCRATDIFNCGESKILNDIIRDTYSFYDLIKL